MPVAYSSVIAMTARTATTAWPRSTPIKESLVGSWVALPGPPVDRWVEAAIPALTATVSATVSATAPTMSHRVPEIVRSLVHSARSAKPRIQMMPSGSMPLNGSSMISTGGSPSIEAAIPRRWRIPNE